MNNGLQNIDEFLKNTLDNHQAELSPNLWGKMKSKLFKNDVTEFVRFKKLQKAFHPQCKSVSLQVKIWASYAVAACLTIGIVYGSSYYISNIINGPEQKTEKDIAPTQLKKVKPVINNTKVEQNIASEIISLPVVTKNKNKLPVKQNVVVEVNYNTPVKKNNQENIATSNTLPENSKPLASKNFNTLISYIQRLNPQDKIVASEKTELITEDVEAIDNSDWEISGNQQENTIQTSVYQIEIPNVFTPNGDGFNDVLVIKNLDKYADNNLLIADRSGKPIYDINSYQNDWDAQNIPDGTYYYILSYQDKNSSMGVIKGLITIIRK